MVSATTAILPYADVNSCRPAPRRTGETARETPPPRRPRPLAALALAAAAFAAPVQAASLSAEDILRQFSLVSLGDVQVGSDIEGRVFVGGDLTAGSAMDVFSRGATAPASDFDALIIGGDAEARVQVQSGGSARIGGSAAGVDMNGHG
ncbi:MAG: collagen-binding domain-containing protein [Pseudomonadota bacterium]